MFSKNDAAPTPCVKCNGEELNQLRQHFDNSDVEFWVYSVTANNCCDRCDCSERRSRWKEQAKTYTLEIMFFLCGLSILLHHYGFYRTIVICWVAFYFHTQTSNVAPFTTVDVPIPLSTVGVVERAVEASRIASKGSDFRAHGTFISHLTLLECPEMMKQSLCCWAPKAMIDFSREQRGATRKYRRGKLYCESEPVPFEVGTEKVEVMSTPAPNGDCEDGQLKGTQLPTGEEYGKETRVTGGDHTPVEPAVLAHQIGPDLIPTEVFESSVNNVKAGLAKRVQPLPFIADKHTIRKIENVVTKMIKEVFSADKIKAWREANPDIDEFKSRKWDSNRWVQAVEEALSDTNARIEQTIQIKTNEALPAKGKAPRPIIQCGDRAQVMMSLPIKCFEDLLFDYFESASIKHIDKLGAMKRVASHLAMRNAHIVEGDGSAWDSCCNPTIRGMTENRVIRHIIEVLGNDPQVPKAWMDKVMADMDKKFIKGKVKVRDFANTPFKVMIDAIRQSGHRGTSCLNYFINLVCWLVVLCKNPEDLIGKRKDGTLHFKYISARDDKVYILKYAFEGDDSAISTTEDLSVYAEQIERLWTKMGFRMKLVYVKDKMTFTGYDFLVGPEGPTGVMIPEIARNVASSSWTTSSLVKQFPHKKHEVGMAAMLARAQNFKDCGAFSRYFASIGLAHAKHCGDRGVEEAEALNLGIQEVPSVVKELQELYSSAAVMEPGVRKLVESALNVPFTAEEELRLLTVDFAGEPCSLVEARRVMPFSIWNPKNFSAPRR